MEVITGQIGSLLLSPSTSTISRSNKAVAIGNQATTNSVRHIMHRKKNVHMNKLDKYLIVV